MSVIWKTARFIRHAPGLRQLNGLWDLLRKPFHRFLTILEGKVQVNVGACHCISIPPELAGMHEWEEYEPETVQKYCEWIERNPTCLILDVGCAIGIFSALGLSCSKQSRVIAFDADLSSLKATKRLCAFEGADRLETVYGLVNETANNDLGLREAILATETLIRERRVTGDVGTTKYVCLDGADESIPQYSLDSLLSGGDTKQSPLLLKCDVEGAELLVLEGFKETLKRTKVDLLLSVHPETITQYKGSVDRLRKFLTELNFSIDCFAIDHEQHWYCCKSQG